MLAACPRLEGLEALRLANCGIGDEGVRALAGSHFLSHLETLDLSNNPISSNAALKALRDSAHLKDRCRLFIPLLGIGADMLWQLRQRYRLG